MTIRYGRVEAFHDDQLVVGLPDLPVVTGELGRLGARWAEPERNAALGLALVPELTGLPQAVHALRHSKIGPELERFGAERTQSRHGLPDPVDRDVDLDLLVQGIRLLLAREYPGWEVTIGKNYGPSLVKGFPHISGGGHGDPEPAGKAPPPHISGGGDGDPEPAGAALRPAGTGPGEDSELGRGVRVGLLDTRLFPGRWLTGRYFAAHSDLIDPGQGPYTVFDGHCAFVASCILQQAPTAELHVQHVLNSKGDGSAWEAAIAIAEMAQLGMDVVNLSFGEFLTDDNTPPMVLEAAIRRFSSDTVVVAAAGNNGDETEHGSAGPNWASYPAALPDVVGVGALDRSGKRAAFTPHPAPWISLLATGVGLTGAYVTGDVTIEHKDKHDAQLDEPETRSFPDGTAVWEGCSFAAGIVSGAIAARTVLGRRSARQALEELLNPDPGKHGAGLLPENRDIWIVPNSLDI
jgi:subtilase family protein